MYLASQDIHVSACWQDVHPATNQYSQVNNRTHFCGRIVPWHASVRGESSGAIDGSIRIPVYTSGCTLRCAMRVMTGAEERSNRVLTLTFKLLSVDTITAKSQCYCTLTRLAHLSCSMLRRRQGSQSSGRNNSRVAYSAVLYRTLAES